MVREPLDGWHERGYVGAALGAYVGIAGTVLKPASGLLECLSKTASGVGSAVRSWGEAPVRLASQLLTLSVRIPYSTLWKGAGWNQGICGEDDCRAHRAFSQIRNTAQEAGTMSLFCKDC